MLYYKVSWIDLYAIIFLNIKSKNSIVYSYFSKDNNKECLIIKRTWAIWRSLNWRLKTQSNVDAAACSTGNPIALRQCWREASAVSSSKNNERS